jgi:hypothetical protein
VRERYADFGPTLVAEKLSEVLCPIKTATQHHFQADVLFWLDFTCENLVYPCNTPPRDTPHN